MMGTERFRLLAEQIAGPRYRSQLHHHIGRSRAQVYQYFAGKPRDRSVELLMEALVENKRLRERVKRLRERLKKTGG